MAAAASHWRLQHDGWENADFPVAVGTFSPGGNAMGMTIIQPDKAMQDALRKIPQQAKPSLARAMNTAIKQAEVDVYGEMRRVFDRPTPWTMGSLTIDKASTNNLEAVVRVKGKADSGSAVPAESYLRAEIDGGNRRFKRFEVALFKVGAMPAGYIAVPAAGARMDAFGNMSAGHITELLAWFRAFPESGYRANTSDVKRGKKAKGTRRTRGKVYFSIAHGDTRLRPGIYESVSFGALGSGVRAVMFFRSKASYSKRLDIAKVGALTLGQQMPRQFLAEMDVALGPGGKL